MNTGTGLGLANVKKICASIGAEISVSSPGEGKGSTFTLVLPRRCGEDQVMSANDIPSVPTHFSLRVLVMDDSLVIRKLMTKYLDKLGCQVVDTASVEESRAYLLSEEGSGVFDMVITDSSMGGGESAPEFIRNIRAGRVRGLSKFVPCTLCSGEHVWEGYERGSNTIAIAKPFSSADIAAALGELAITASADQAKV